MTRSRLLWAFARLGDVSAWRLGRAILRLLAFSAAGVVLLLLAGSVAAQTATPAPLPTPFDPRGGGNGPGVVGAPFIAALAVIALGIAAAGATALYVRLAAKR
jgi:hypothetical protein